MSSTTSQNDLKKQKYRKVYDYYSKKFPKVPQISIQDFLQRRQENSEVVLIDSRTVEEQEVSIIPGALTQSEFSLRKDEYKSSTVVCYCTVGYRSGACAQGLINEGFNAYNLQGSILGWVQDGQKVVDKTSGDEVKKVHVFASFWAYQPDDYEEVTFKMPAFVAMKGLIQKMNPFKKATSS